MRSSRGEYRNRESGKEYIRSKEGRYRERIKSKDRLTAAMICLVTGASWSIKEATHLCFGCCVLAIVFLRREERKREEKKRERRGRERSYAYTPALSG